MIDAAVKKIRRPAIDVEEYLGPAEVVEVRPRDIVVSLPEGEARSAELAFVLPYAPIEGDVLLVIGRGARLYAIGVLRGSGRTALSVQGDLDLRSVNGKVSLSGERGVEIRGAELDVQTGAIRMVARDVLQKFESVCQRVSALLRVHAGEAQTLVDQGSVMQAKRAAILTEETTTINGREIHLG